MTNKLNKPLTFTQGNIFIDGPGLYDVHWMTIDNIYDYYGKSNHHKETITITEQDNQLVVHNSLKVPPTRVSYSELFVGTYIDWLDLDGCVNISFTKISEN